MAPARLSRRDMVRPSADVIWEWLEDMPLPVVLVVVGSIVLIVIAWAIRSAVQRVGTDGSSESGDTG